MMQLQPTSVHWFGRLPEMSVYAEKSVEVMNAWARTCQKVSGNSNGSLASGFMDMNLPMQEN